VIVFPIYVDLVIQNLRAEYSSIQVMCPPTEAEAVSNSWPLPAAVLHPIINMIPGAIDPRYTEWQSSRVLRYGIEQGLLRAIGALVIVGGIATLLQRRIQRLRGGLPIGDERTILYLNIQGLPVADAFVQELARSENCEPGNLAYAQLYPMSAPRPDGPPHNLFREWYVESVDFNMDVTDTSVLRRAGALYAPCVILSCNRRDILWTNALSIWNWRRENGKNPSKIIPISEECFGECEPLRFADPDLEPDERPNLPEAISEAPLCPFVEIRKLLMDLTGSDKSSRTKAIQFLVWGVPITRREKRETRLNQKLELLAGKKSSRDVRVYLNGAGGSYGDRLGQALSKDDAFKVCNERTEADLILTYGDCSLTGDIRINDYAEQLCREMALGDRIHLYLTFSQGNEDSASFSIEAGASIQRILVKRLLDETADYVVYRKGPRTLLSNAIRPPQNYTAANL
jgi:hypothetical protein